MLHDPYPSDNIADVLRTIETLFGYRQSIARGSKLKFKNSACLETLKAMKSATHLLADLWVARGLEVFEERLDHYQQKAQGLKTRPLDILLYEGLTDRKERTKGS